MSDAPWWAAALTVAATGAVKAWRSRRKRRVPPLVLPLPPPPKVPTTPPDEEAAEVMRLREEIAELRSSYMLRVTSLQERIAKLEETAERARRGSLPDDG